MYSAVPSSSALIAALVLLTGCPSASSGVADADADASVDAAPTADHGGHDAPVAADAPEDAGPDGAPDAALAPVDPLTVATWNIEQFPKNSYSVDKVA